MQSTFLNIFFTPNDQLTPERAWLFYERNKLNLLSVLDKNMAHYFSKKYQLSPTTFERYHALTIGINRALPIAEMQEIYESTQSLTPKEVSAAQHNPIIAEMSQYYQCMEAIAHVTDGESLDRVLSEYERFCGERFIDFNAEDLKRALHREMIDRPQQSEMRQTIESMTQPHPASRNIIELTRRRK